MRFDQQIIIKKMGKILEEYEKILNKVLFLLKKMQKKNKALQLNAKGLVICKLPRQDDFRTFCMSEETESMCQKLEEVIGICQELKNRITLKISFAFWINLHFLSDRFRNFSWCKIKKETDIAL